MRSLGRKNKFMSGLVVSSLVKSRRVASSRVKFFLFSARSIMGMLFELSAEAQKLIEVLSTMDTPGNFVSYEALNEAAGKDVQQYRSALSTARRRVKRDSGYVFGVERGIGLKRLSDEEIAEVTLSVVQSVRRQVKGQRESLELVDRDKLSELNRMKLDFAITYCGLVELASGSRAMSRIQMLCSQKKAPLKMQAGDIAEMFNGS